MKNYNFEQVRPYMIPCHLQVINRNDKFHADEYAVYHYSNLCNPICFKEDTAFKHYISGILAIYTNKVGKQIASFYNNDGKLVCKFYNYNPELLGMNENVESGENTITVFDNLIVCEGFVNGKQTCLAYDYKGNSYEAETQDQLIENLKANNKYLPMYIDCQQESDHEFSM